MAKRVIPAFHVGGLSGLFANALMRVRGKHGGIGFPKVAEAPAAAIGGRDTPPEATTGALAVIADDEGDDLTCSATQDGPQPAFPRAFAHKRPDLVDLQSVIGLDGFQGLRQGRQRAEFFLSSVRAYVERRRRRAQSRAYSVVLDTLGAPVRDRPAYTDAGASAPRRRGSLYRDIAGCHIGFGHF